MAVTCSIPESFRLMYDTLAEDKKTLAATFNLHDTIDYGKIREQYQVIRGADPAAGVRHGGIARECDGAGQTDFV